MSRGGGDADDGGQGSEAPPERQQGERQVALAQGAGDDAAAADGRGPHQRVVPHAEKLQQAAAAGSGQRYEVVGDNWLPYGTCIWGGGL